MIEKQLNGRIFLVALLCLLMTTGTKAQLDTTKTLSPRFVNAPIDSFFNYVRVHAGFRFIYGADVRSDFRPVTYWHPHVPLHKMLDTVLGSQGLGHTFSTSLTHIRLYRDEQQRNLYNKADTLEGRVTDENGQPMNGVSVSSPENHRFAITSYEGIFKLPWPAGSKVVEFSYISHENITLRITDPSKFVSVILRPSFGTQVEVISMPYNQVTRRDNTGSGTRVRGQDLTYGSANVFNELAGRAPGLTSVQSGGAPGAAVRMQIRGRQSIGATPGNDNQPLNDPIVLINKIPFVAGNKPITRLSSAAGDPEGGGISGGGISAQAAINPADVETIDILKDADATAIYGSRGAHGAILITTKDGRISKPAFRLNLQSGATASTYIPQLLDNREYTAMRKEALAAANIPLTKTTAPDLLQLDTNNYINVPQLLAGGTGRLTNINASMQGGDTLWRYYGSAGYYRETSVMPKALPQQRFTSHANIRYRSPRRRLQLDLSLFYSLLDYNSLPSDPLQYSGKTVPLLPSLHDAAGNLVWKYKDFDFRNPLGQFENTSHTRINTFTGGLQGSYRLAKDLYVHTTLGYQRLPVQETLILRRAAGYPTAEMSTAYSRLQSFMIEPRLEYDHTSGDWQYGGLLGATLQHESNRWAIAQYSNIAEDSLIGRPGTLPAATGWSRINYRYQALYGRWHTDWDKRYYLNATGRLDASSRLGPRRKAAFFGALGAAWVFSDEQWFRSFGWLRYGKLRTSYGATGNDNYNDYNYPETWSYRREQQADSLITRYPYRSTSPRLDWEINRKLEVALELQAFQSLSLELAWYRNVTTNQIVSLAAPGQPDTVPPAITNSPAKVLNTGWEFTVRYAAGQGKNVGYTSTLVLTLPRNRLLSFPGLESSPYKTSLVIGQPLSVQRGLPYSGVSMDSGLFIVPASPDTLITGHWEPMMYAGWSQEWRFGRVRVSLFIDARIQHTLHPWYYVYAGVSAPGRWSPALQQQTNQPRTLLQRWQHPGDAALLQRFTAANTAAVQEAIRYFRNSSIMMASASFWRIRSVYVGWELPGSWLKRVKVAEARVYVQGQNLFTGTSFRDGDPSLQFSGRLSAQRVVTMGVQLAFQ